MFLKVAAATSIGIIIGGVVGGIALLIAFTFGALGYFKLKKISNYFLFYYLCHIALTVTFIEAQNRVATAWEDETAMRKIRSFILKQSSNMERPPSYKPKAENKDLVENI